MNQNEQHLLRELPSRNVDPTSRRRARNLPLPVLCLPHQALSGRTVPFALGIRKDVRNSAPVVVDMLKGPGAERVVATIRTQSSAPLASVEGIVWSHYHVDHTGDPTTFPSSTALIIGPRFKGRFEKAYPSDPESPVKGECLGGERAEADWVRR